MLYMATARLKAQLWLIKVHVCMQVEINTWLLIAKRTVKSVILEAGFYVSWVGLRNIFYPYLIYAFWREVGTAAWCDLAGAEHAHGFSQVESDQAFELIKQQHTCIGFLLAGPLLCALRWNHTIEGITSNSNLHETAQHCVPGNCPHLGAWLTCLTLVHMQWKHATELTGTPLNAILITPIFQTLLTGLK